MDEWIDRYFARIGYDGPRSPTLETLAAIHRLHPAAISFESLDALGGRTPDLALAGLQAKLIDSRRGGWCFEQNTLFQAVLEALGFHVASLAARVQWQAPPGAVTTRSHMLLKVSLSEGDYIADVGFGGHTPTAPLRFAPHLEQSTPHGTFRLNPVGTEFQLQAKLGAEWANVYQFSLEPWTPIDYETANWVVANHPRSPFTTMLMASRAVADGRYNLMNTVLTVRALDGCVREQRTLPTPAALAETLDALFDIEADEAVLRRLFADSAAPTPAA